MTEPDRARKSAGAEHPWPRRRAGRDQVGQHDEVVAVDDLVGQPSGSSAVRRPATARSAAARVADQALGERRAGLVDDLDRVVGVERALDAAHPGRRAATGRRSHERPAGAVVDDDAALRRPGRTRSTACGSTGAAAAGRTTVPTGSPGERVDDHVGRVGGGDHRAHARPRRDLGRRELARHAAAPPLGARAAGDRLERGVDLDDLLDQRRRRRRARGSAVKSPAVSVSSTSTSAPTRCDTSAARRSLSP